MQFSNLIRIARDGGTVLDHNWEQYLIHDSPDVLKELLSLTQLKYYSDLLKLYEGMTIEELLTFYEINY